MKIAFITSGTINSSLSSRPLAIGKELYKKGHEVYIFAPRFDKYSNFKDEGISHVDGVKIVRPFQIQAFSFEFGLFSYIISSIVMLHFLKPDIIHIFKPNPITLSGLLLKLTRKTPIVLDTDDLDSEVMEIEGNSSLRINLVKLSEKLALKYATAITAASKYLYKNYSTKYKTKPISYIPNGAQFTDSKKIKTNKLSKNRIVFLGNINRVNILEPLFYAIKDLKQQGISITTTIIGDGNYLSYFKNLSKKLRITDKILFLGHISQNNVSKFIKVGDIGYCYMPDEITIKACSSMKVFQYMQYGAVPLVRNVGDLPLYIFKNQAGYIVNYGDNNSLTNTITEALSNTRNREKKIKYAIKNAGNYYRWSILAEKTDKFYKKLI